MGEPTETLVRDTRTSLVDGAERAVRRWLSPGRFRPGDRLPPEQELAGMLGVSRGTLRSALRRLELSGEIVRRQGSGTFVGRIPGATSFAVDLQRLESFATVARRHGLTLANADVRLGRDVPAAEIATALGIGPGEPAVVLTRTLVAGERPLGRALDVVHPRVALGDLDAVRARLL